MGSYRDVFAWGNSRRSVDKEIEGHIRYFLNYYKKNLPSSPPGLTEVLLKQKSGLSSKDIAFLEKISGKENVLTDSFSRLRYSYGKFYGELLQLRAQKPSRIADAVVRVRHEKEIAKILEYCSEKNIAVLAFGGGSSVTRAVGTPKGGVVLDLGFYLNRVVEIHMLNHTVTVQAGILGPHLEQVLNKAGFTCGHFPQSFEFSTVGGWIAAKGAGQASTGYGGIEDLLVGLRVVTPIGILETNNLPRHAMGFDLKQLFIGSEGTLGIITQATLKIFPFRPRDHVYLSFFFKSFSQGVQAMRETMQSQIGFPHLFRLSDAEETKIAMEIKGYERNLVGKLLHILGYKMGMRSLMYATLEGQRKANITLAKLMRDIARRHGGLFAGGYATKKWLRQRFSSAYVRDPLMDAGIRIDTLETAIAWDGLEELHAKVREYVKKEHQSFCLSHISHAYETGANLYFVFVSPMHVEEEREFERFHKGLVEVILRNGGALSHHHGIGRLFAPYLAAAVGKVGMSIYKGVKRTLDPAGILNPGVWGL
ncbi:MAG: FAD-binding oxidoreductase [Leptospiraceae bacterium]|nr:FAD-binding oxidoreductase [Leptospiraceae bacterium]MDW8306122.1 FAD-binding oxidoreductase [Leptospiraceae bacterium]